MPLKPVEIVGPLIRVDLNWWESCNNERGSDEGERDYLNSIIETTAICPRVAYIKNTQRARKILGLHYAGADSA